MYGQAVIIDRRVSGFDASVLAQIDILGKTYFVIFAALGIESVLYHRNIGSFCNRGVFLRFLARLGNFAFYRFQLSDVDRVGIGGTGRNACDLTGIFLFLITYGNRAFRRFPYFGCVFSR